MWAEFVEAAAFGDPGAGLAQLQDSRHREIFMQGLGGI